MQGTAWSQAAGAGRRARYRVEARAGDSRAEVENSVAHAAPALPESKRPDLSAPHSLLARAFAHEESWLPSAAGACFARKAVVRGPPPTARRGTRAITEAGRCRADGRGPARRQSRASDASRASASTGHRSRGQLCGEPSLKMARGCVGQLSRSPQSRPPRCCHPRDRFRRSVTSGRAIALATARSSRWRASSPSHCDASDRSVRTRSDVPTRPSAQRPAVLLRAEGASRRLRQLDASGATFASTSPAVAGPRPGRVGGSPVLAVGTSGAAAFGRYMVVWRLRLSPSRARRRGAIISRVR
jgi:hypothetical protein